MIDYGHSKLFQQGSVDKQWKIQYNSGVISNKNLFSQSIELTESLCSEPELRFGCCEASVFKFKVANVINTLQGRWITVSVVLKGAPPFYIGKYKVISDKVTADKQWREITAYDALYDVLSLDVAEWYEGLFRESGGPVTMRHFRRSFMEYAGLEDGAPKFTLTNDNMLIEKTILPEKISGKEVITAICEINGCFGHIGRDGRFYFIYLQQNIRGLYPSNTLFPGRAPEYLEQSKTGSLYPQEPQSHEIGKSRYIECHWEDFITKKITKLQIRKEENDIGVIYGTGDNCYIIENNFLVYGKSAEELTGIAQNIFNKITDIVYRPFDVDAVGNPCFEVGDPIRIPTKYQGIESYILKRTLKGVQALRDACSAEGVEVYSEKVNSVQSSIVQLKGKTNLLERTVDGTLSEIYAYDEDGKLYSRIEQNAKKVEIMSGDDYVSSKISVEKGKVVINGNRLEVNSTNFKLDQEGNVDISGKITARDGISLTWTDSLTIPEIITPYVFVETKYNQHQGEGGIYYGSEPYLIVKSPNGTEVMVIGSTLFSENQDKFKMKDTPYFPNGAMIADAYIKNLYQNYSEFEVGKKDGITPCWANMRVRMSGAFVCLYGTYHVHSHKAGEQKDFSIDMVNGSETFFPTHVNVKTVGNAGKRIFLFIITKEGEFIVRNVSESDVESESEVTIIFRFDYFRF